MNKSDNIWDDDDRQLLIILKILQIYLYHPETIKSDDAQRLFSANQKWSSLIVCGDVMAIQFYHFQGIEGFTDAPDAFFPLSDWQVSLVELVVGWMGRFSLNEISVLSLLPFYLQ